MLALHEATPQSWVDAANGDVATILVDHAHCEKKAASTALNLIFRYQDHVELMAPLSALAREELLHFEQVLAVLQARGIAFVPLEPAPYASRLYAAVRREEPWRRLDTLLACALIEARSCERMKLLSEHLDDPELRALYAGLLASEARHFTGYVELADAAFGRNVARERLRELALHEAAVLREPSPALRMHSQAIPWEPG
jgi:tRNA 2-(methylsulfanyl)-N6-isopentenyladenosine37 hydroxylase